MHSQAFIAVFVAAGAIPAFFLALFDVPFAVQTIVWLLLSALLLATLRPSVIHRFRSGDKPDLTAPAPTAMTDLTGVVEEEVGDDIHPGRVVVRGERWRAVTEESPIPPGERIVVRRAAGTTLWVERS